MTDGNPFRYCGEYYDKETKTLYLRARYYDSATGRFTSEDPIKDGSNWYSYCNGNPINFCDPSGLAWWHWAAAIAVVAVCAIAVVATAGGAMAGIAAVAAIASGTVASTAGATIASGALIGASTELAASIICADASSNSHEEFADKGEQALVNTGVGAAIGIIYGAFLEIANTIDTRIHNTSNNNTSSNNTGNNGASTTNKNCHNPNGRKGGEKHRNTIAKQRAIMEKEGYKEIDTETHISTVGGQKPYRYADISGVKDGETHYFQIGKSMKTGTPDTVSGAVSRERKAIYDIINFGDKNPNNVHFISYNK